MSSPPQGNGTIMNDKRETLGSRLGFLLLSAGCAIGLGNIWKFPYVCGQNGGAVFLIFYFLSLAVLAIPVLTMEFSLGRAARTSPVHMYQKLERPGSFWHLHGILSFVGSTMLMMFYTVVAGWMLGYFVKMVKGDFTGASSAQVGALFNAHVSDPMILTIELAIVVFVGFFICSIGLRGGLERVTKIVMLALFGIMVALAIHSLFLKGGAKGLAFYLKPDFSKISTWSGLRTVVTAAMMQAFFTLSLGIGSMAIFGSYIGRDRSLFGESVTVAVLDTFVAVSAGLIIFPACFAYDVDPGAGPSLIFVALPNVFNHMQFGRLWGSLFFVFMSFAAFSTVIAVFEEIIACVMDLTKWSRAKVCLIGSVAMFLLALPCVLGFSVWSGFQPFGKGTNVLDLEDFIVSYLLLPGGSLIYVLFCTTRAWGWKKFTEEANEGKGLKIRPWMRFHFSYIIPPIVLFILVMGLLEKFL